MCVDVPTHNIDLNTHHHSSCQEDREGGEFQQKRVLPVQKCRLASAHRYHLSTVACNDPNFLQSPNNGSKGCPFEDRLHTLTAFETLFAMKMIRLSICYISPQTSRY